MSDFVPRDILPDLWEEILRRHWTFLETEESMQKLEERKKLEGCLKEFLCVVPHDRKFFLPETSHVLRKTIRELDEFTAYKAIIGFESISQYANNLFTKPWRKEYRVIKMYSGFFQHEIKSNLLDAEKLFEAMGYRQVSSEILVLDGPICPDQVTNVSRDAMAAYMECQIIKHIYAGVIALGLNCSWQDVYHYREKQIGGSTQAIKGLAYALQERRLRKERLLKSENTYATIQHANAPQTAVVPQCQNCAPYHHHHMPPQAQHVPNGQCAVHNNNNITSSNTCAVHANNNNMVAQPTHSMYNGNKSKLLASYPAANYQQHAFIAPGIQQHNAHIMSHSRSLEHYNEPHPPPLPHRHSFDHQQQGCMAHPHQHLYAPNAYAQQHLYESPYDCIDGLSMGSSSAGASYAAVASATAGNPAANCNYNAAYAHPYNVSGNRYPLPYNISNQLNSHYETPATVCNGSGGMSKVAEHHYMDNFDAEDAKYGCNHHAPGMMQQRSPLPPTRHHFTSSKDFQAYRQRSFPPDEQLIDFDDRAPLTKNDFHAQLQTRSQNNSFDYERDRDRCERMYEQQRSKDRLTAGVNRMSLNSTYAQPKDALSQQQVLLQQQNMRYGAELQQPCADDVDGNYVYARPRPKAGDNLVGGGGSGGAAGGMIAPGQQRCGERYARDGKMTDKYLRNSEQTQEVFIDNNRKMQMELNERSTVTASSDPQHIVNGRRKYTAAAVPPPLLMERDTSDVSYESTTFDDFVNVGKSEHAAIAQRSPTQAIKNQDGVGSFESWDYVFQNLERSGYNKDLGERGDLLVQSLDLDSLNLPTGSSAALNGSTEKRRSSHALMPEGKTARPTNGTQARTLEKTLSASAATTTAASFNADKRTDASKTLGKQEKSILKQSNKGNVGNNTIASGTTKIKSALKSTVTTTMPSANSRNNNNNNGEQQRQYARTLAPNTKKQSQNANKLVKQAPPPVATQVIVTSPNEWSCRVCTFLNPDTKRICEMCCRSKDFNLDSVVSNTPTCV